MGGIDGDACRARAGMGLERDDMELMMKMRMRKSTRQQRGMSLIELMIACFILAVGMTGSLAMILMAIAGNNRNKLDSTATMLAQLVIEQVNVRPANSDANIPMTDCLQPVPNNFVISTVAGPSPTGAGAPLVQAPANPLYGRIDWLQAAPGAPYSFNYAACDGSTYDVRWNVMVLGPQTKLVTVSARRIGSSNNLRFFAIPPQLRTISGP